MLNKILNSHHAILVEGDPLTVLDFVKEELGDMGIVPFNNPDVIFLSFEKFGIAESRTIIEMANGAPIQEDKKRIIFGFNTITGEAQNALLKIFEDPSPQLGFIMVTYSVNGLLPTLKSRLHVVPKKGEDSVDTKKAEEFINMSIGERMEEVERMVKDYKDNGDKRIIKDFILSIHYLFENKLKKDKSSKNSTVLKASSNALNYIDDKSSSVKILLESVVLAL